MLLTQQQRVPCLSDAPEVAATAAKGAFRRGDLTHKIGKGGKLASPDACCLLYTQDEAFDRLVAALYGDVAAFEAAEEAALDVQTAAHQAEWQQRNAAFEQQRARAGVAGTMGRPVKRPRWGDAYDDVAFEDLDAPPSESEDGPSGSDGDDERDDDASRRRAQPQRWQAAAREADPGPYGAVPPARLEPTAAAAAAIAAALAPAAAFPDAVALGRMFNARVGPPTVVHLDIYPLDAASVPAGGMALPFLSTPHVVAPAAMQAAKLGSVLALYVDMADEVAPGTKGSIKLREGEFPVAEWMTCLQLKQRADARGVPLRLSYFFEKATTVQVKPPTPVVDAAAAGEQGHGEQAAPGDAVMVPVA